MNTPKQDEPDSTHPKAAIKAEPIQLGSLYEKRKKIFAREVKGVFATWRWVFAWFTQLLFYGLCWIDWNDRQAVLFHLVERKFYLFGLVLWPQDVFYLAVLLIISAYGLFLFTAVAGRLFCGYACPQTVYTLLFMWIENRIEGDRPARMKLEKQPYGPRKIALRGLKHLVWATLSLWTGFTLVGYFTPIKDLMAAVPSLDFGPWETFWILFYGAFTYFMAGFMREQMCKYVCPYARFQGVMFDPDTLIISYDQERGEPRGPRKKDAPPEPGKLGDCIDCGICVQVCPTGIDIRNGLQIECIGCSACIDGCDQVMDKVGLPRGLIRYSTENALARHYTGKEIVAHVVRPRVLLYSAVLLAIMIAMLWGLYSRVPLMVDVIRDRASMARELDDGLIENSFQLMIMNTSEQARSYNLSVSGLPALQLMGPAQVEVPAATGRSVSVALRAPPDAGKKGGNQIFFEIQAIDDETIKVTEKASFIQP
jgi:cytochrome c oxidase accessory protein FixG